MPIESQIVVSFIVAVFVTFGVTLAFVSAWSRKA